MATLRSPLLGLAVAAFALVGAACSSDDTDGDQSDDAQLTTRLVIALDVAVPASRGGWSPDAAGSTLCTFGSLESVTFTATAAGENVLVEKYGTASIESAHLGAYSGEIANDACTNLLTLDVSTSESVTVEAFTTAGTSAGNLETSALSLSVDEGLSGRRSVGSPWTLGS